MVEGVSLSDPFTLHKVLEMMQHDSGLLQTLPSPLSWRHWISSDPFSRSHGSLPYPTQIRERQKCLADARPYLGNNTRVQLSQMHILIEESDKVIVGHNIIWLEIILCVWTGIATVTHLCDCVIPSMHLFIIHKDLIIRSDIINR